MFQPTILNPSPDPWFVHELRRIDPDLRIVWAYGRYFQNAWAIERRMPPERYFACYSAILSSDESRYVDRPIFDTTQPIVDSEGNITGHRQIGVQRYDLAPEFEWVAFAHELDQRVLLSLKRSYAWERNHSISRLKFEKEQEAQKKEVEAKKKRTDAALEGLDEALNETRMRVHFGYGETRNEP